MPATVIYEAAGRVCECGSLNVVVRPNEAGGETYCFDCGAEEQLSRRDALACLVGWLGRKRGISA